MITRAKISAGENIGGAALIPGRCLIAGGAYSSKYGNFAGYALIHGKYSHKNVLSFFDGLVLRKFHLRKAKWVSILTSQDFLQL